MTAIWGQRNNGGNTGWGSKQTSSIWGANTAAKQQEEAKTKSVWGNGAGFGSRGKQKQYGSTTGPTGDTQGDPAQFFDTLVYPIQVIPISTLGMRFSDNLTIETESTQTTPSSQKVIVKVQNLLFNECFSIYPPSLVRYYDYISIGTLPLAKSATPTQQTFGQKSTFGQTSFLTKASDLPPKNIEPWQLTTALRDKHDPIGQIPLSDKEQPYGVLRETQFPQFSNNLDIDESTPEISNVQPLLEDRGFVKPPVLTDMMQKGIFNQSETPGLVTALIARKNPVDSVPLIQESMFSQQNDLSLSSSSNQLTFLPSFDCLENVSDLCIISQFGSIAFNGPISPNFVYSNQLVSFAPGEINVKRTFQSEYDLIPTFVTLNHIYGELSQFIEAYPNGIENIEYDEESKTLTFIVPSFDMFPVSFSSFYIDE